MLTYIKTENAMTVFAQGKVYTIDKTHPFWDKIEDALRNNNDTDVLRYISITDAIDKFSCGHFRIENDRVFYKDHEIKNGLTKRINQMIKEGYPVTAMLRFLDNLMQNPSNRAINELYGFLETNSLPITEDGCFVAYKRINQNWTDVYSGAIDNSVGQTVSMPRNAVDDNPNNTCSHGLHVCSLEYLKHFSGEHLIAAKVNPRDVVSVPVDYENTKMRVCEYTVLTELDMATIGITDATWPAVYEEPDDEDDEEDEPEADDYYEDEEWLCLQAEGRANP